MVKSSINIITVIASIVLFLSACGGKIEITHPDFDGQRAFSYIEKQVSFGPRVPDTDNSRRCREYLIEFFDSLGAKTDTMEFPHNDKITGKAMTMVNVLASFDAAGEGAKRYLFAAHYDSRPRAEYDPDTTKRGEWIDGANDGASGVAVLMELANLLSQQPLNVSIDFALLDGEDYGRPGDLSEYCLGAKDMILRDIKGKYEWAIIVDLIGDKDLRIPREANSQKYFPDLNNQVWNIAKELGETAFVDTVGTPIYDDHLSFMTIKLPAIVIIDFNYKYWHTTHDTPDKCSPQSLRAVGNVLTTLIYRL